MQLVPSHIRVVEKNMSKNCKFLMKDGTPCRADVEVGNDRCVFHDPVKAEEVRRGRRQGGIKRCRQVACFVSRMPDRPPTTTAEISPLLADMNCEGAAAI